MHYPYILHGNFLCQNIQFSFDVFQYFISHNFSHLVGASAFFFVFGLVIFFGLVFELRWTFTGIILTSLRRNLVR